MRILKIYAFIVFYCLCQSTCFAFIILKDGFESGDASYINTETGAEWGALVPNPPNSSGDYADIAQGVAHTGNYSFRGKYAGDSDITDDATIELHFHLGNQHYAELWLEYWLMLPSNYVIRYTGGERNNKMLRIWGDAYGDGMQTGFSLQPTDTANVAAGFKTLVDGWPTVPDCNGTTGFPTGWPRVDLAPFLGTWLKVKLHLKKDSGAGDGILDMWLNDDLVLSNHDVVWVGAPCVPIEGWNNGYFLGWANSGFDEDTVVYIDDVTIATTEEDLPSSVKERKFSPSSFSGAIH